jgi:hypothetical protein
VSGAAVGQALERRFEEVRRAEIDRLSRKFTGFTPSERVSAEQIIADVISGVAREAAVGIAGAHQRVTLEAVVRLFRLDDLT